MGIIIHEAWISLAGGEANESMLGHLSLAEAWDYDTAPHQGMDTAMWRVMGWTLYESLPELRTGEWTLGHTATFDARGFEHTWDNTPRWPWITLNAWRVWQDGLEMYDVQHRLQKAALAVYKTCCKEINHAT